MFADDLVVVGAGKLLAAESVASITARNTVVVVVETVEADQRPALREHLTSKGLVVQTIGTQLHVHGTDRRTVAQVAQSHHIAVLELTAQARSLEDSLLELTASSAEFASA
jgi:ABC-2 type transport system ATP-binding protein